MIWSDAENLVICFSLKSKTLQFLSLKYVEYVGWLYARAIYEFFLFFNKFPLIAFRMYFQLVYQIRRKYFWVSCGNILEFFLRKKHFFLFLFLQTKLQKYLFWWFKSFMFSLYSQVSHKNRRRYFIYFSFKGFIGYLSST